MKADSRSLHTFQTPNLSTEPTLQSFVKSQQGWGHSNLWGENVPWGRGYSRKRQSSSSHKLTFFVWGICSIAQSDGSDWMGENSWGKKAILRVTHPKSRSHRSSIQLQLCSPGCLAGWQNPVRCLLTMAHTGSPIQITILDASNGFCNVLGLV